MRWRWISVGLGIVALGSGLPASPGAGGVAGAAQVPSTAAAPQSDDDLMRTVLADVQSFWATELPAVYGMPFDPIPASRLIPYSAANPPPGCGLADTTPYEDVEANAFYCTPDDFVAWDTDGLIARLRAEFGDLVVALVAAHEMGHAVQQRTGTGAAASIPFELQADCFTGAWVAHATTTTTDSYNLTTDALEQALSGFLFFRDPQGTNPRAEGAHGSAFDRIAAFSDGFTGDARACRGYETVPPTVTETTYGSQSDADRSGNLPFDEIFDVATRDLDRYWKSTAGATPVVRLVDSAAKVRSCGKAERPVAACGAGVVAYSRRALREVYEKYGDFGVATLLAQGWADAAVRAGTVRAARAPDGRSAECLAGAWAAALLNGLVRGGGTLSPGDLDEAVAVLLAYPGVATRHNGAFTRFEAFHTGFDECATACGLLMQSR